MNPNQKPLSEIRNLIKKLETLNRNKKLETLNRNQKLGNRNQKTEIRIGPDQTQKAKNIYLFNI